jgi:membrane fusion protein, multidrug efflux system
MSKRILIISIITLLTVFFIGKNLFIRYEKAKHMGFPPPTVEVATAKQQHWQTQINATGTILAMNGVVIKPEVAGKVTRIDFTSGSYVEKGQPLIQIYPDILAAQLASDEANLSLAQAEYRRANELYAKNVASKQTFDEQIAKLKSAQAAVAATQAELAQHNITAPFSGKIGLKQVDIGDYVNVGQSLVSLEQIDPLRVQFSVPDRFINDIRIGSPVHITVSSSANKIYEGYVYALDSAVDPSTRLYSLWAKIPNPDHSLIPGTYVEMTLFAGESKPVIVVPQTAVLYSSQGEYVYKIENNKAIKTQISSGERQEDNIAITDGIQAGDVVVTAGQVKLFDGMPVTISKAATYDNNSSSKITYIRFSNDEKEKNMAEDKIPPSSVISEPINADTSASVLNASKNNALPSTKQENN